MGACYEFISVWTLLGRFKNLPILHWGRLDTSRNGFSQGLVELPIR